MKKILKITKLLSLVLLAFASSCDDVLVNEDPNGVVIDQ